MGGLAVKKILGEEGVRLNRNDYIVIVSHISTALLEVFTKHQDTMEKKFQASLYIGKSLVTSYKDKESFGDADFVLPLGIKNGKINYIDPKIILNETIDKLNKDYGYVNKGQIKNTNVTSFDLNGFQVDFIFHNEDIFDAAIGYYAYNDLGNLVGRIAHHQGLKYGHDGLSTVVRKNSNTQEIGTIILSKDTEEIYKYFGLDYNKRDSISSIEDIFNLVIESPYFKGSAYKIEELNHINRIRNKKRTTYMTFIDWLEKTGNVNKNAILPSKEESINRALKHFNKEAEYKELVRKKEEQDLIHSKFNGDIVKVITLLEKENLGKFIIHLKQLEYFSNKNILNVSKEEVENKIKEEYKNYVDTK